MRKLIQGIIVACLVVVLPLAGNTAMLLSSQAWILIAVGILASLFQPAYNPFEKAPDNRDRGTANQIIWSIYITQIAIITEAAYLRYPSSIAWDMFTVFGLALMLSGLVVRTWAVVVLGKYFTWHISTRKDQTIITSGPYAYIRHPGYFGAFLTYIGTAVFLHSWFSLVPSALILWFAFSRRIQHEENELKKDVGETYVIYCEKSKRFFPGIW